MGDESAWAKLARVETVLDTLLEEVRGLRGGLASIGERLTRLEEATRETIPQVWPLQLRVAQLEKETAELRMQLQTMQEERDVSQRASSNRWWDVAKLILTPVVAAAVGFVMGRWVK